MGKSRECGKRQAGGVYLCCGTSENGSPVEEFLIDPPIRIDAETLGVSPIGVTLVRMKGEPHVIDWVGSEHYPNVADFIEETRAMGVSRRVPKTFDFAQLTRKSSILLAHTRAWPHHAKTLLAVAHDIRERHGIDTVACPQKKSEHGWEITDPYVCADAWWHDYTRADADGPVYQENSSRIVRTLACERKFFAYGHRDPDLFKGAARWSLALFMRVPIISIEVVRDAIGGTHEDAAERASVAAIPVVVCDD